MTDNVPIPVLMTRPMEAAKAFWAGMEPSLKDRLVPTFSPLIEPVTLSPHVSFEGISGVIFSSAAGPRFAPPGQALPAYCVGEMTTLSAKAMGWNAQFVAQTADELVEVMLKNPVSAPLLHLGGRHTRGDVADRLSAGGMPTTHIPVYEQRLQPLTPEAIALLSGEERVLVPLFSPRTSAHFVSIAPSLERVTVLALSEAVALPLPYRAKTSAIVADAPTGDAMQKALHAAVYPSPMG